MKVSCHEGVRLDPVDKDVYVRWYHLLANSISVVYRVCGLANVRRMFNFVGFPAPFGPSKANTSP